MRLLDWYIIRKYLSTFFFVVILFSIVAILIDVSERIAKLLESQLSPIEIFQQYYLHFIPWINGLLWPLFALLSVIYFVSRLARNSEIIVILGAGISFSRLMIPIILSSFVLAALLFIGNNYVIPNSTKHKVEFQTNYIKRSDMKVTTHNFNWFIADKQKIFGRYYNKADTSINTFRLEEYDENGFLLSVFKSKTLKFIEPPSLWRAIDYEIRKVQNSPTHGDASSYSNISFEVDFSRNSIDTVLSLYPDDFIRYSKEMEMMTTPDLNKIIRIEQSRGLSNTKTYEIEKYRRTSDPFSLLILSIIGATIAARKVRGGLGLHLALGVAIGSIFIVISKFTITFATNLSLPPILGCWLPNIIFAILCLILWKHAQK